MNPYFCRTPGEAVDGDQIEHDGFDPFYISDEDIARAKAIDASNAKRLARLAAQREANEQGWTVTTRDLGNGRHRVAA